MIIDFHTHIFPSFVRHNRHEFFRGEPAFKLLYESSKSRLVGKEDIIRSMDEQQVDKSVIFGFPWKNPDLIRKHNDYILEAVTRYPDRLIGFCCFDMMVEDAVTETERCLENGFSGVGELAAYRWTINEAVFENLEVVMKLCEDKDLPVLIHANEPVGHQYPGKAPESIVSSYQLLKRFPDNKIVLAHWGGGLFFYSLLKKEVKEVFKNTWFDTAASPFLYDIAIYKKAVELIGSDKILFGSDYPLIKPTRYFDEMIRSGLSTGEMNCIKGENALKILAVK